MAATSWALAPASVATLRKNPTPSSSPPLRGHFAAHSGANAVNGTTNGSINEAPKPTRANYRSWTHMADDGRRELEVPKLHHSSLLEEREAYDITVKLFYSPRRAGGESGHADTRGSETGAEGTARAIPSICSSSHSPAYTSTKRKTVRTRSAQEGPSSLTQSLWRRRYRRGRRLKR